jgi:hypothetical protein
MTARAFVLLGAVLASCGAPPAKPLRAPVSDFQPLEPGLEWTYDLDGRPQVRSVTGAESIGRFECQVVETRTGDIVERAWMRWDQDWLKVYRVSSGRKAVTFEDPIQLVSKRAAPGWTWKFTEQHGPLSMEVQGKYEGDEEILVLDRLRPCARIRLVKRAAGRVVIDQTCWYVRNLGLVRMTVVAAGEDGEVRSTLILRSCNFTVD